MRRGLLLVVMVFLAGCISGGPQAVNGGSSVQDEGVHIFPAETQTQVSPTLEPAMKPTLANLGPAPELSNEVWTNSVGPLRLADLRGKVVLLEMWTFG
jgi:hypothetical protein